MKNLKIIIIVAAAGISTFARAAESKPCWRSEETMTEVEKSAPVMEVSN